MKQSNKWYRRAFILFFLLCFSGLGQVYMEHQKRILFIEYQGLIKERDTLKTEWKRIQIELAQETVGTNIEKAAEFIKGNMIIPNPSTINIIDLNESSN